jgi:peptide deformylase
MEVNLKSPVLRQQLPLFDFNNPSVDPIDFATKLTECMVRNNGLGLAGNQCGWEVRAFAIASNPVICCFNPRIVDASPDKVVLEEACLSFPQKIIKIKRPNWVKVRYTEPNGNVVTTTFEGLTARVFQHELDHLDGVTMFNRGTVLEKQRSLKAFKKLKRAKK